MTPLNAPTTTMHGNRAKPATERYRFHDAPCPKDRPDLQCNATRGNGHKCASLRYLDRDGTLHPTCRSCGARQLDLLERQAVRSYKLASAMLQERLVDLSAPEAATSLMEEVALARMLVQKHLDSSLAPNSANGSAPFNLHPTAPVLTFSSQINRLTALIGRMVEACTTIEADLSTMLHVDNAFALATAVATATEQWAATVPEADRAAAATVRDGILDDLTNATVALSGASPVNQSKGLYKTRWDKDIREFLTPTKMTSLAQEVAITRVLLEEVLNQSQSLFDLIVATPAITEHITTITNLVSNSHRLQKLSGLLMTPEAAALFADHLTGIVTTRCHEAGPIGESLALLVGNALAESQYSPDPAPLLPPPTHPTLPSAIPETSFPDTDRE